jgi:hypothetical protein
MPSAPNNADQAPRISPRRAARMYRLVTTLAKGSRSRADLIRLARAGMRTFYRDLTLLEEYKIHVHLTGSRYRLDTSIEDALGRLPFPAPRLSFSDVIALSKGRGSAHAKLKAQFNALTR